jgi:hypothetical protein
LYRRIAENLHLHKRRLGDTCWLCRRHAGSQYPDQAGQLVYRWRPK